MQTFDTGLVGSGQTADQEHRYVSGARVFLQTAAQFETANIGHDHVADNDVGMEGEREFDSLGAIHGGSNFVTFEFEEIEQ